MDRQRVYEQLKIDEGVKYEIYKDHLGYPTFGVGHLVKGSDPEHMDPLGTPISEERVQQCFEEILVTMMFNMGRPRLTMFKKINSALNLGDWKVAAVEGRDSRWYHQVTNRAERLMVRLENVA